MSFFCRMFSSAPNSARHRKFLDRVRIQVVGGKGGRGVVSFEHLDRRKRRPAGGSGGPGGSVFLEASKHLGSFDFQTFVLRGKNGNDAKGVGGNGRKGRDTRVLVPCGTVVYEINRTYEYPTEIPEEYMGMTEDGSPRGVPKALEEAILASMAPIGHKDSLQLLGELNVHGDQLLVAQGGRPGLGNKAQAHKELPEDAHHFPGDEGESKMLQLEMKTIADIGLVGLPNAGKSTFLSAVSRAKPKVAAYPFTTLNPLVGIVRFQDGGTLSVADIPGLIEGAHENRGLGHDFLRHIERTKVLAYIVDASADDPVYTLKALQKELYLYQKDLAMRPSVVVANKVDLPGATDGVEALRKHTHLPVIPVSAKDASNVGLVIDSLRWILQQQQQQ